MTTSKLSASELRCHVDAASLGFTSTTELQHLPLPWIGQERAEQATRFGLTMGQRDYNLFVLGEVGSGRSTLISQMMRSEAAKRPTPPDLCYLYNHDSPEHPRAMRLPAGEGRLLRQLMGQLAKHLQSDIPKRLSEAAFKAESDHLSSQHKMEEDRAFAALTAFADARNFSLTREQGNMVFTLRDPQGQPLTTGKAMTLTAQQRVEIDSNEEALRNEISRYLEQNRAREHSLNESLATLKRQAIKPMLEHELQAIRNALRKQIKDSLKLGSYLEQVQHDMLENLELFQPGEDEEDVRLEALLEVLSRLRVNVAVDNHELKGAPVILEDNPLFRNLFGSIEYESDGDMLTTDFSRIRAGSLVKAHGGFLMLHLRDLLADESVWEKLRRYLRSGRLQIEEPSMMYAPIAAVSLQPDPIDVDVKIVLIASVEEYYAVQEGDPEFARRFRCKVDFADTFKATPESFNASAIFVAHTCDRLGLLHFSAAAVATLIEASHREAEDQVRQSAIFGHSEALVMESSASAHSRGATLVESQDVYAAMQARVYRHSYPQQRLQETLVDGERLLDVTGEKVAQLNGLTVIDLGDYQFGFPVRVTASTYAGHEGLLNIEREVKLSGPIHDKGVLILHSYLSALFAHIAPLALDAAIVFEQEYSGVEGDSASCAELYALLSSLSGLPLKQGIAVTGAVNQHGEMLPVGGINEKIEGYFRSCELLGLDGQQGVLIPARNRRHLMLDPSVVQAVAQGQFHIYTADLASDGIELLTGASFGTLQGQDYPADSLLGMAQKTLQTYRKFCDVPRPLKVARRLSKLHAEAKPHHPRGR
nr:ATP-binding protein [uncultured Rhodoferax sp.]